MIFPRSFLFFSVLLVLVLNSHRVIAGQLCEICDCKWISGSKKTIDVITCETKIGLFNDDVVWPVGVERINLIHFKDIISAVLPIFKCDKAIGEIKFESSGLKGIDTKSLSYLPNVEKMSFATNLIEKLSQDNFKWNTKVRELDFRRNKLEDLPEGIFAELTQIDLSFNRFQIFSDKLIGTLKGISVVNLRNNNLYAIDQVDMKGVRIGELDLSGNNLRFLKSNQFKSFSHLTHLNLSHNFIKDIQDDAFTDLDSLTTLDLSNNHLLAIDLILPHQLTKLFIRNNVLAAWPIKEIATSLSTVDLRNNTLEILHIKGAEDNNIEHLIVSLNQLESFPNQNFPQLKSLDLSSNKFEEVPELLGKLTPKLQRLDMSSNPIENLHFSSPITVSQLIFKNMPHLQVIGNNSFENVTARSSSLESEPLLDLQISHCPLLTEIAEDAFGKINFYDLDLSYNHISHLPQSLTNWTVISGSLNLQGNPWSCECADEWMMTEILVKLYEDPKLQFLLEDLRCASPDHRRDVRYVHFYRHVTPFCGTGRPAQYRLIHLDRKEEESDPLSAGFNIHNVFQSNRRGPSPWIVVVVCAFTVICLTVAGIVLQRDINRRREESRRRMYFSNL